MSSSRRSSSSASSRPSYRTSTKQTKVIPIYEEHKGALASLIRRKKVKVKLRVYQGFPQVLLTFDRADLRNFRLPRAEYEKIFGPSHSLWKNYYPYRISK